MKRFPIHNTGHTGPTAEQWQAYLENRLSPAERARVEAMLQASEDDREAMEGLQAMGAEPASALVAGLHKDIDIMTAPERGKRGAGVVRRLGYVRMGVAAAVLVLFGAGFWMLSVLQQQKTDRQAFDRYFEPIAPTTESGAYTEQLVPGASSPSTGSLPRSPNNFQTPAAASFSKESAQDGMVAEDAPRADKLSSERGMATDNAEYLSVAPEMSSYPPASDDLLSFNRAEELVAPLPQKAESDAAVSRPQVSSQAAQKTLVLEDKRKQENPMSIKGSRQLEERKAGATNGEAVSAPGAVSATDDAGVDSEATLREDGEFSPESGSTQTESLADVSVSAASNRGYKPAPDPYQQGQAAYAQGDYRMATEWLSKVPAGHPQAQAADLLEANAWLERDKPEKAIPLLEGLKVLGPGPLYDQTRWYLALARIAQGDEDPAMALLEALILENGPYRARALELLSDLGD